MITSHEKRTIITNIRLTPNERQTLVDEADACGLSLSAYIRQRSFGKRVAAKTDLRVIAELRRIGGLLKHIHNETKGAYSAKTAEAIREITRYVRQMNEDYSSNRNHEQ